MTRARLACGALALLAGAAACRSPEAARTRGAGPGADIGNRGAPVVFHHGAKPYHETPCVTQPVECSGPPPVFSTTWKP